MPPRLPSFQCLRAQNACPSSTVSRPFSSNRTSQASTVTQKRKHRDPYAIAQARARKDANLSRQEVLQQQRNAALGDPVRGSTTPYVQSFDTGRSSDPASATPTSEAQADEHLNFYVSKREFDAAVQRSKTLTRPLHMPSDEADDLSASIDGSDSIDTKDKRGKSLKVLMPSRVGVPDPFASHFDTPEQRAANLRQDHATAAEAMKRIANLDLGSSKDRLRLNKQRIIDTFGRHNTDATLPPKPQSVAAGEQHQKAPRVGPDTGSSEVQIGILTAKIRTLADFLQTRGHSDKVNKRNLRLLVHRRAKLLNYLRRKERGGPRWQNLIETLGLTEGTWKGEITM